MGASGNRDCQWSSRSALKDFAENALTISAGSLFQNGTARSLKAYWRRRVILNHNTRLCRRRLARLGDDTTVPPVQPCLRVLHTPHHASWIVLERTPHFYHCRCLKSISSNANWIRHGMAHYQKSRDLSISITLPPSLVRTGKQ